MNRVYNEMTSDEVHRGTGVKVGNFGVGGRTYSKYKRGSSEESKLRGKRIFIGIFMAFVGGWFYVSETSLAQTVQCADHVKKDAVTVPSPFDINHKLDNVVVYAAAPNAMVNSPSPSDPFFGVNFASNVASARRVTEYCQWQETAHRKRVKVGTEPNCRANDDTCNIYREDKTYTYHKAWRTHRIPSMMFDNPTAYHNPQRDPCPAATFHAEEGIRLDGTRGQRQGGDLVQMLHITAADATDALTGWTYVPLSKTTAQATQQALSNGFHDADRYYIYSRGETDGWTNIAAKAALTYMADGVIDLGDMGTCKAGDIRVSFESKMISDKGMAVAGKQLSSGQIVPFSCRGKAKGTMVVGYPDGTLSVVGMAKRVVSDAFFWTMVNRAGQVILTAICLAVLVSGDDKATGRHDASMALFLVGAVWGAVWMWDYPTDFWSILPMALMAYAGKEYTKRDGAKDAAPTAAPDADAKSGGSGGKGGKTASTLPDSPPPTYDEATKERDEYFRPNKKEKSE